MLLHANLLLRLCLEQMPAEAGLRAPMNCKDARKPIRNFTPGLTGAARHNIPQQQCKTVPEQKQSLSHQLVGVQQPSI